MERITIKELNILINKALNMIYKNDKNLIDIDLSVFDLRKLTDTNKHNAERAVVFRFAHYLQNLLSNKIKNNIIDCEYNKHIYNVKKMRNSEGKIVTIIPDIIIHSRLNDNLNLLVIECKGWWNAGDKERNIDKDKLKYLTNQEKEYKYTYGLFIEFAKNLNDTIKNQIWYKNGEKYCN